MRPEEMPVADLAFPQRAREAKGLVFVASHIQRPMSTKMAGCPALHAKHRSIALPSRGGRQPGCVSGDPPASGIRSLCSSRILLISDTSRFRSLA